jgi:GNAT superfamily N-acetyltransferase
MEAGDLAIRPVAADELGTCGDIWRSSINDYLARLSVPEIPPELGPITRLYGHLRTTDPDAFVVAVDGDRIIGFAAAVVRERLWFLSMLFVRPEAQGRGLGRALLTRIHPAADADMVLGTGTDAAQPISNALYAMHGIVPRMPLLNVTGLPVRPEAFGSLPSGVTPAPFDEIAGAAPDGRGHGDLVAAVDRLDRATLGFAHPADHRFLRGESRRGWLYRGPDGGPLGYGYAGEGGRVGPVAALDEMLVAPILGHLMSATQPRGAFAIWLPGDADRAVTAVLRAGLRLDQFPVLLCWSRDFADFRRYLPISPGLL